MCTRIVLLFTILLATGCNKGGSSTPTSPTPTPTITTITIALANAVLFGGSTEQATATATLSNGTTQQATGTWGVDNANVASVDQTGRVTAQASGRANVLTLRPAACCR